MKIKSPRERVGATKFSAPRLLSRFRGGADRERRPQRVLIRKKAARLVGL